MKNYEEIRWFLDELSRKRRDDYFYGAQSILVTLKNELFYQYSSNERWKGIEDAVKWFFEDPNFNHEWNDSKDPDTIQCHKCGEYKIPWKETICSKEQSKDVREQIYSVFEKRIPRKYIWVDYTDVDNNGISIKIEPEVTELKYEELKQLEKIINISYIIIGSIMGNDIMITGRISR